MKSGNSEQYQKAALALKEADIVLIVTGAGFSADSGLAVYEDVAKVPAYQSQNLDYAEICQPKWLHKNPELFYGFWGQCFNDYRKTKPHEGYSIIRRWRQDKLDRAMSNGLYHQLQSRFQERKQQEPQTDELTYSACNYQEEEYTAYLVDESAPKIPFHIFTSNVDAHFYDYFDASEIYECHGNIELWQCSEDCEESGIWRAPLGDHAFEVDLKTMLAPPQRRPSVVIEREPIESQCKGKDSLVDTKVAHIGCTNGSMVGRAETLLKGMPPGIDRMGWLDDTDTNGGNWPRCGHCRGLARPAILMFGDFRWKSDSAQEERWEDWTSTILDLCKDNEMEQALKACVIEIGCGLRVPTCRFTSEDMVEQLLDSGSVPTLIRINPNDSIVPRHSVARKHSISIAAKGLEGLRHINEIYQDLHGE